MRNKILKKHYSVTDIAFIAVFIIVISMAALFVVRFYYQLNDYVQNDQVEIGTENKAVIAKLNNNINIGLDYAILALLVTAMLAAGITSLLIDVNPIFFVFGLIYYTLVFIIIPIGANMYLTMQGIDEMAVVSDKLPITYFIMNNYVLIWVVMSGVILVALYGKLRG